MPLMGERVLLRALEERDLDPIWEAYKEFDLQLITDGDAPPVSDRQVHDFWSQRIATPAADMCYFAIEPLTGQQGAGQFAGMCNLQDIDRRNRHAELALWLAAPNLRGLGYGTDAIRALLPYAFEVVRLDKVYVGAYDFNEVVLRCNERVGFRYEGRLQQEIYYQGRYWDEWRMRMLRSEWEMICRPPAEGLRPYHPADQDRAITLLQRVLSMPDHESARAVLRRWWRQIDRDVYSYQVGGELVGLITLATNAESPLVLDIMVQEQHRSALDRLLPRRSGA